MATRLSSKEQEELVLENRNLVHYHAKRLQGVNPSDYEDMVSIGTIGLIKAAATFDKSKKVKFGTYASRCINNEFFMHFRKTKTHANDISLDEPIIDYGEGHEMTLGDKISSSDKDFTEIIVENEHFVNFVSVILNALEPRERLIMLYKVAGKTQHFIANALNLSQTYVSRLENKTTKKIQKYLANKKQFNETFTITKEGDMYKISFYQKDIKQYNKNLEKRLQNIATVSTLPNVKITFSKGRIVAQIPAHPEFFYFIAQIIKEIDDFSIYVNLIKN